MRCGSKNDFLFEILFRFTLYRLVVINDGPGKPVNAVSARSSVSQSAVGVAKLEDLTGQWAATRLDCSPWSPSREERRHDDEGETRKAAAQVLTASWGINTKTR